MYTIKDEFFIENLCIKNNKNSKSKFLLEIIVNKMGDARIVIVIGGARGVMVIVAGYGHGDTSSNPGPDWLHFT